jgi:uncharacterized protein (DUF1810 family)
MNSELTRFIEVQNKNFSIALSEIKSGKKTTHWMWYVFPQISGLGHSEIAKFYEIKNLEEACNYLYNDYLSQNLFEISKILYDLKENNANKIFGFTDVLKLKSSMTLFYIASNKNEIFKSIIDKYFNGVFCESTIQLIKK